MDPVRFSLVLCSCLGLLPPPCCGQYDRAGTDGASRWTRRQMSRLIWSQMETRIQKGTLPAWLHPLSPALRWSGPQGGRMSGPAGGEITCHPPVDLPQGQPLTQAQLPGLSQLHQRWTVVWMWRPLISLRRNGPPAGSWNWRSLPSGLAGVHS